MTPGYKSALKVAAVAGAVLVATAAFYAVVTSFGLVKTVPAEKALQHVRAASTSSPTITTADSLDENEQLVPTVESALAPPVTSYLLVQAAARVTSEEGAVASLEAFVSADCPGSPADVPRRRNQAWAGTGGGEASVRAKWCLPMKAGTSVAYRDFNGSWTTSAGVLDADYAANYLVYTSSDGRPRALKTMAVASCDDDKGCGYVASISLGEDDSTLREWVVQGNAEMAEASIVADSSEVREIVPSALPSDHLKEFRPIPRYQLQP